MKNSQLCKTIINQWQQDYQTLHDLLSSEQTALEKRDFIKLEQAIKEKDRIVRQINAHQLPPLIDNQGVTITSLTKFKQHCLSELKLKEGWETLMALIEKCRFKNEVNARLVELLNQSSKRTFNLIKGFDPDNNIYNANGNSATVRHYGDSLSA